MVEPTTPIFIHQCLHGYSDGHRLLQTSTPLTDDAQAALLVFTDLPESVAPSGFSPFLTGYPLQGSSFYALARTWYAQEMPRPGCVWTHTLLIPLIDLARIPDLTDLRSLHQRPLINGHARYEAPVLLSEKLSPRVSLSTASPSLAQLLLAGIYGVPTSSICVSSPDDQGVETLVLSVWSQQWPRLRRTFSFRTAVSLEAAPAAKGFDVLRGEPGTVDHVDVVPRTEASKPDLRRIANLEELRWLTDDLFHPGRCRELLWSFGADAGGRSAALCLVAVFRWLESADMTATREQAVLQTFARAFPNLEQASRLKRHLFDPASDGTNVNVSASHRATALEFACSEESGAAIELPPEVADLAVQHVWPSDRRRLIELAGRLLQATPTPSREAVLAAVFARVTPGDLGELASSHRGLVYSLVARRPAFASSESLWRSDSVVWQEAVRALRRSESLTPEELQPIVSAVLNAGNSAAAVPLAEYFTDGFARTLLSVLSKCDELPREWDENWSRILSACRSAIEEWLAEHGVGSAAVAAAALPLLSSPEHALAAIEPSRLRDVVGRCAAAPRWEHLDLLALVLTVGFGAQSLAMAPAVCGAFQPVYLAAERNALPFSAANRLDRALPSLWPWGDWDLCRRLCMALRDAFVEQEWPPGLLIQATPEPRIFLRVLVTMDESKRGRKWRKALVGEWSANTALPPEHRRMLRSL